ncbi:retrovirus-related pol polyprotein from transposon TNT 1-94 [Tanacetum coccineum]
MGMVDNILFTKKKSSNLIIVQIYVDDIIFISTCQEMCDDFAKIMHDEFEMSMMGELNFFLGLQIKQMEDGIFFNQSKYIKEMLKKFSLEDSKPMKTPMSSDTKLTKDEECESIDSTKYRVMIEKSALVISTTEAEYVSTEKACQQALWMNQALIVYGIRLDDVLIIIPIEGQCSFTDKWSLDYLASSVLSNGPYQTTHPTPDDIKIYVQVEREEPITRIRHDQDIDVKENQILTCEITPIMKT